MPENQNASYQEPSEGSRCVAGPGGSWGPATIHRVNEDGTYNVEFDVKELIIMRYWYGVTPSEISFNDDRLWAAVFAKLSPDGQTINENSFPEALTRLGYQLEREQTRRLWSGCCEKLFNVSEEQAESLVLNSEQSYKLFLQLGVSARACAEKLTDGRPQPYLKLYWNQTRMGGREPDEIGRAVTLADAFAALGLQHRGPDHSATGFLKEFERKHAIRLPSALVEFISRDGVAEAVADCHPNNPNLVPLEEWDLRRGMKEQQLSGDYAIVIMLPHQGDHECAIVFDEGDDDARVYYYYDGDDGEDWALTAPGIGIFFWDLAQTGLAWDQDTKECRSK